MGKWNNFFLQRMGTDQNNSPYPVKESVAEWGIFCKDIPFKIINKVKEPAKRVYHDEHGDDEYIGPNGLYVESYDIKVEFGCKKMNSRYGTTVSDVRVNVGNFLSYLRTSGMMKMYSSYTRIGRQNVRLSSIDDDAIWESDTNGEFLIFKVTFKVNDPVTDITLSTS